MGASVNMNIYDRSLKDQVIMGDCIEVLDGMPDNSVDMVLTDPPYHIPVNHFVSRGGKNTRHIEDTAIISTYFKLLFSKLKRVTRPSGAWYVFCDGQSFPIFYNVLLPLCHSVRPLIWDKMQIKMGHTWRMQHEIITYATPEALAPIPTADGDVLRYKSVPPHKRLHPAQKPLELLQCIIHKHPNAITVLDPFAGSGSSLVAAHVLGRHYVGIELNGDHVDTCLKRLASSKSGILAPAVEPEAGLKY